MQRARFSKANFRAWQHVQPARRQSWSSLRIQLQRDAMKAIAVFPKTREVKIIGDHPEPAIASPTEVKLRVLEVGVCGTDKEICRFDYGTPPSGSDYLVLGHESLGEVVEAGSSVTSLKPGDLVVTMVRRPCDHADCFACRAGRQDFCYTGDFKERGIKEMHGFMAEFVVDDEKYMHRVPAELRDIGVLTEPLTIAEKALAQVWQVQKRLPWGDVSDQTDAYVHKAVVLGAGPVGLLGALTLAGAGFKTFVYSRDAKPNPSSDLVEKIGGIYISSQTHAVEQLAAEVGNIDLVYEATGASKFSFETLKFLGTNGVFIFTGVPGRKAPVELDTDAIMRNLVLKNQVVFGSVNAGRDAYRAAIDDLATFKQRWPDAVRSLITGHYAMENFRDLLLGEPGGIKNVIAIGK
jgi:glucose 1-dehydrogenase